MSAEEQLLYIGLAAYLVPPAIVLAIVARARRRAPAFIALALFGWLGMAAGRALLLALPPGPPRYQGS